ncbi:MAG: polysaccharide deacetylase family protein [Balneolaceae bacterium]|nr:polysaccharide deacetylase family protein [Balneolaceae bacterium]
MKRHQTLINTSLMALLIMLIASSGPARAQEKDTSPWNGKQAAVALTYDDALAVQLQHAVPLLDSLDLKATFYLTGYFPGFRNHIDAWKEVAVNGHELGNHTLFHPCKGGPGREWVQPDYDLSS